MENVDGFTETLGCRSHVKAWLNNILNLVPNNASIDLNIEIIRKGHFAIYL